jgi:membrane protein implicated in regulation of membrane protease activity
MNLVRRVSKLEKILAPTQQRRVVIRYEGDGSEALAQEDIDENTPVIVVRYVDAAGKKSSTVAL